MGGEVVGVRPGVISLSFILFPKLAATLAVAEESVLNLMK